MATLKEFLDTGRLGPLVLGMSPTDAMNSLGDAEETSRKTNPLQLKYGALRLVFWKSPRQARHQLREIIISFQPEVEPLPDSLQLSDFAPSRPPTESEFRSYMHGARSMPVHLVDGPSGRQLLFLSGVSILFAEGTLHSIRLEQKSDKQPEYVPSSGEREPSLEQIAAMLEEAARVMEIGAVRSALMIAWAGLEAALRREAARAGIQGRVGVQPSILIRELLTAGRINADERDVLEELRQIRTAAAHGLAPIEINADSVSRIVQIGNRLLKENGPILRKYKEVEQIMAVEAIEAFSVLANTQNYESLANFFKSRGLRVHVEENAVSGEDPQHDIQVQKSISFPEFNRLLGEWKKQYAND